ncbi:hypothetical protein D9756_002619 [Leucocoprinus leucothites]|uniref:NACHT domain-containing protein n=1 Tax=Leucocoprinus leucothites TaxID=201217 RepID=A0A8H5LMD7_9AGAR|nr:hypothetical protein D9756_002619 [Leucoagaricus leucothites]
MFSLSIKWLTDLLPSSTDFCIAYAGVDIITPHLFGPSLESEEKFLTRKREIHIRGREVTGRGEDLARNLPDVSGKVHRESNIGKTRSVAKKAVSKQKAAIAVLVFAFMVTPEVHQETPIEALEKISEHTIPGARYNSAARDPPPRCHPGTRASILQELNNKVHDEDTRVIWVHGPAGSGKSAVMQSLAEALSSSHGVNLATVFLSRDVGRDDANRVFPSIAYDLAVTDPIYRHQIEEELVLDPEFLSLSVNEQFQWLFVRPLLSSSSNDGTRRWAILIDGLDECQGKARQKQIIENICEFARSQPQLASLVEEGYLKTIFDSAEGTTPGAWRQRVPIDSPDAVRDVEVYLRAELGKVFRGGCPLVPTWPAEEDLMGLAHLCSGFFFLASSLAGYITEANSIDRLAECLAKQHKAGLPWLQKFYTQIISSIPSDLLPTIGSIVFFHVYQYNLVGDMAPTPNISLSVMCNILGLKKHDVYAALYHISSVLSCPSPEHARSTAIEVFHPSLLTTVFWFPKPFGKESSSEIISIWKCYTRVLQQFNRTNSHRDIAICWPLDEDQSNSFDEWQQHTMLQFARDRWMAILTNYCHNRCKQNSLPCPKPLGKGLSLSPYEAANAFQGIGLESIMSCAQHRIASFLDWITNHTWQPKQNHAKTLAVTKVLPSSMCNSHFFNTFEHLTALSDGDAYLKDVLPQSWQQAREKIWNESSSLGELFKATQHRPSTHMFVLQNCYGPASFDPTEIKYAIIGPLDGTDSSGDVYYVVRY